MGPILFTVYIQTKTLSKFERDAKPSSLIKLSVKAGSDHREP